MQINFLIRKKRRARFIVATPDLSGECDHTTNIQLKLLICIIASVIYDLPICLSYVLLEIFYDKSQER